MKHFPEAQYLTVRHVFIAYARMRASREKFPAIRDYHGKKWRILAGLFEIALDDDSGIADLADRYASMDFYHPCGGVVLGSNGVERLPGFTLSIRQLRRHAAGMRRIYTRLGIEWLVANFPGIEQKRVHVSRLKEFQIPAKPPNETEECIKAFENDDPEILSDDVPARVRDELKRKEEARERAKRDTEAAKPIIMKRALDAGIGTPETVSQIIFDMDACEFLKLTEGYPKLSRVDFKPRQMHDA